MHKKKHHHNYDALSFLSCIIFWIFFFLRHCCELLRDLSRFPSNTPRTSKYFGGVFWVYSEFDDNDYAIGKERCCMVHYF
jgi:hypothetical protein